MITNLTPHDVTVVGPGGETIATYPRPGAVARAVEHRTDAPAVDDVPLKGVRYSQLENLPDPQPDHGYIVSVLTVLAAQRVG